MLQERRTNFVFTRTGKALPDKAHAITDVVFDADGTLIDSMTAYARSFETAMREFDVPGGEAYMIKTAGTPLGLQARQMFLDRGMRDRSDEVVARYRELMDGINFPLFPDAESMVRDLSRAGCNLYISTGNVSDVVEREIRHAGIASLFAKVLASDVLPKSVQHVEEFAAAQRKSLGDFTEHAVFIGDGPTDMEIAQEAGMLAVGVSRTVDAGTLYRAGADLVVSDLSGVYDYIGLI